MTKMFLKFFPKKDYVFETPKARSKMRIGPGATELDRGMTLDIGA